MKLNDRIALHQKSREELVQDLKQAEADLLQFRFDAGLKRLTNPAGIHKTRKQIARLKTLIRQKDLLAEHPEFSTMDEYKAWREAERQAYHAERKAR